MICDILSRWEYPASEALRDISMHGSKVDDDEMPDSFRQEEEEERMCLLFLRDQTNKANLFVRGLSTRSGKVVHPPSGSETESESDDEIEELGEEEPGAPSPTAAPLLRNPSKHVTFMP
jgi:hypothetical protein